MLVRFGYKRFCRELPIICCNQRGDVSRGGNNCGRNIENGFLQIIVKSWKPTK
jgi:hypothetical protein